jgi:hypothetical protein
MQEIVWKDEYCIGIEEIDKQHMDFLKLMNRFNIIFGSGAHIRLQDRILLEILRYTEYQCVIKIGITKVQNMKNQQGCPAQCC